MFTLSEKRIAENEKTIVLIGFMGVGKTTVGELLAQKLNRTFIDVDQEIEKDFGMSIPDIFTKHGEPFFRELEQAKTCDLAQEPLRVLSLGGGAFLNESIQKTCLDHGIVIHLDIDWEEWTERMELLIDDRPLLQSKDLSDVQELFYKRQSAYAVNHARLLINKRTPEEVADALIDSLKQIWASSELRN